MRISEVAKLLDIKPTHLYDWHRAGHLRVDNVPRGRGTALEISEAEVEVLRTALGHIGGEDKLSPKRAFDLARRVSGRLLAWTLISVEVGDWQQAVERLREHPAVDFASAILGDDDVIVISKLTADGQFDASFFGLLYGTPGVLTTTTFRAESADSSTENLYVGVDDDDAIAIVLVRATTSDRLNLQQELSKFPEFRRVTLVQGSYQIVVEAICENERQLMTVVAEISRLRGVLRTTTQLSMPGLRGMGRPRSRTAAAMRQDSD